MKTHSTIQMHKCFSGVLKYPKNRKKMLLARIMKSLGCFLGYVTIPHHTLYWIVISVLCLESKHGYCTFNYAKILTPREEYIFNHKLNISYHHEYLNKLDKNHLMESNFVQSVVNYFKTYNFCTGEIHFIIA